MPSPPPVLCSAVTDGGLLLRGPVVRRPRCMWEQGYGPGLCLVYGLRDGGVGDGGGCGQIKGCVPLGGWVVWRGGGGGGAAGWVWWRSGCVVLSVQEEPLFVATLDPFVLVCNLEACISQLCVTNSQSGYFSQFMYCWICVLRHISPPPQGCIRTAVHRRRRGVPSPLDPPPPSPLPMLEADSHHFATAPSVPRCLKMFGLPSAGTIGGPWEEGGPSQTPSPF